MANAKKMQELKEKAGQYNMIAERLEKVEDQIMWFVEKELKFRGPDWKFNLHELGQAEQNVFLAFCLQRTNFQRSLDECVHELLQALESVFVGVI